jgi:hypothetical protein
MGKKLNYYVKKTLVIKAPTFLERSELILFLVLIAEWQLLPPHDTNDTPHYT